MALLEGFIESYDEPPKKIIQDIDDTDDITHGAQQLSLFNGYHDDYCYMPVHLYEGHTGKLITPLLRPGCRMRGAVDGASRSGGREDGKAGAAVLPLRLQGRELAS